MKKIVKHYLMQLQWTHDPEPTYGLYPFLMEGEHYALVKEMDIEIEVPDDFDPRAQKIAALEKQRQTAMAEHERFINMIDGKIACLRCIEHKEAA